MPNTVVRPLTTTSGERMMASGTGFRKRLRRGRRQWPDPRPRLFRRCVGVQKAVNNPVWKTGVTTLCRAYVVRFISCLLGAENTLDVCKAAKVVLSGNQSTLIIRGTGQVLDEGLVVGSMSCPIAKMWYGPLPTMIVVSITSSATPAAKARFSRAEKEVGLASPMLDVVVRGH